MRRGNREMGRCVYCSYKQMFRVLQVFFSISWASITLYKPEDFVVTVTLTLIQRHYFVGPWKEEGIWWDQWEFWSGYRGWHRSPKIACSMNNIKYIELKSIAPTDSCGLQEELPGFFHNCLFCLPSQVCFVNLDVNKDECSTEHLQQVTLETRARQELIPRVGCTDGRTNVTSSLNDAHFEGDCLIGWFHHSPFPWPLSFTFPCSLPALCSWNLFS